MSAESDVETELEPSVLVPKSKSKHGLLLLLLLLLSPWPWLRLRLRFDAEAEVADRKVVFDKASVSQSSSSQNMRRGGSTCSPIELPPSSQQAGE